MKTPNGDVTRLLSAWAAGEARALDELIPLVYEELRRIARRHWSGQSAGHTLQPTALINEAFLKLVGQGGKAFENRTSYECFGEAGTGAIGGRPCRSELGPKTRRRPSQS